MSRNDLERYRVAHNLDTPASFSTPRNEAILTGGGIARHSPTMRRARHQQRQSEVKLRAQVRKHFNAAAVNETAVVAEMQYAIKNKGRQVLMLPCLRSLRACGSHGRSILA